MIDYFKIEHEIKEYFEQEKRIENHNKKISFLENQIIKIRKDIDGSNIFIDPNIRAISYDNTRVQSSNTQSEQDRALEDAFYKLESEIKNIQQEIVLSKKSKIELENKNYAFKLVLEQLGNDEQKFLKLRYKDKKSFRFISYEINLSMSTLARYKLNILEDVYNLTLK